MPRSRKHWAAAQTPLGAKKEVDRVALAVNDPEQVFPLAGHPVVQKFACDLPMNHAENSLANRYGQHSTEQISTPRISLKQTHTVVRTHPQCDKFPRSPGVNESSTAIWK